MHVIAAKAVALRLAATRGVPRGPAADGRERPRCSPPRSPPAGRPDRLRRHRQPRLLGRRAALRASPGRRPSGSSTTSGSPSTRTPSPSIRPPEHRVRASGVGTPATTTRGFGPDEMREVGRLLVRGALRARDEPAEQARIAAEVRDICARFPVPGLPGGVIGAPGADDGDDGDLLGPGRAARRAFVAAALLAFGLTPVVRRFAQRARRVDHPDERRVNTARSPRRRGRRGRRLPRRGRRRCSLLDATGRAVAAAVTPPAEPGLAAAARRAAPRRPSSGPARRPVRPARPLAARRAARRRRWSRWRWGSPSGAIANPFGPGVIRLEGVFGAALRRSSGSWG